MGRFVKHLLAAIAVSAAMASPAWAVALDFNMDAIHPVGASISYAGGAAPLIGSNIGVDTVVGLSTPSNSGANRDIFGGILSFTTGGFTGNDASSWFFAPGGTITLTGGVDLNDDGDILDAEDIPAGTTLFSGSFVGTPKVLSVGNGFNIVGAGFDDLKDEKLAAFYGLSSNGFGLGWDGGLNLSFQGNFTPGSAFSSEEVRSGDIVNTPIIPEPTSLLLLGLGLIGGVVNRRKLSL